MLSEAGGHRWQEVSPKDKAGRVHTSTVTVAVIMDGQRQAITPYDLRDEKHFEHSFFSGTGKGGQHRNRHPVSVRMVHLPTGLSQKAEGRIKQKNLEDARSRLIAMLDDRKKSEQHAGEALLMREQRGLGQRGDRFRTYRFQDDSITDHRTGKTISCKTFMRGEIDRLW